MAVLSLANQRKTMNTLNHPKTCHKSNTYLATPTSSFTVSLPYSPRGVWKLSDSCPQSLPCTWETKHLSSIPTVSVIGLLCIRRQDPGLGDLRHCSLNLYWWKKTFVRADFLNCESFVLGFGSTLVSC